MRSILRAVRRAVPYATQYAVVPCLLAGLAGCASPGGNAGLGSGPRSIVLTHPSGESVAVTYWRGDGYDADALREISVLFRDRRSGETIPVDPTLVDMLVALRQRTGAPPDAPICVTSGYRSTATNAALARSNANVAENSYHMRGQAVDFSIPGVPPARLAEEAAAMQRGGYALYPHTGHVHVDTGPFRTWTPKSGGEPRGLPAVQEARARARKAERVQVAEAPKPAPPKAQPAQIARAMAKPGTDKPAIAKAPLPPDLSKVRTVLAQLKEQPAPGAKERKRN